MQAPKPIYPKIRKDGTTFPARKTIDFVEGANVTITATDSEANDLTTITIASSGGGGGKGRSYFPSGWG